MRLLPSFDHIRSSAWARLALLGLGFAFVAGCGSDGPTVPSRDTPNFVRIQSDAGDYVGGGKSYEYTQANSVMTAGAFDYFLLEIRGDTRWSLEAAMPDGSRLRPGTYANLTQGPFEPPGSNALSFSGDGRVCSSSTGTLIVDDVTYAGSALTSIDLRFEQRCTGATAALHGTVHWRADDTTLPPGPVTPIPASLWTPATTPTSGNYVVLASDPGDYVGQGSSETFASTASPITVTRFHSRIAVDVGGYHGEFQSMLGTAPLAVGYYSDLRRYPFHNPAKGGLSWTGNGRGCNTLSGWFAVDRVVYTGETLTAIDLRFEQHCEMGTPALRGAIHWSA